ncbi:hypothetical protein FLJU110815_16705 [Flavobacterium jumunjinense]
MIQKDKIYLILSAFTFVYVLYCCFFNSNLYPISFSPNQIIWLFILFLPILNIYNIIINRDADNRYYWIAIVCNILSIVFIMKTYKIDLF